MPALLAGQGDPLPDRPELTTIKKRVPKAVIDTAGREYPSHRIE